MQDLDDTPQVLELLDLLPVGRDGDEDRPHAITQNAVREGGRVEWVLDLKQLLHALLGHLLDVPLVALEELEENADDLGLHLDDVKV